MLRDDGTFLLTRECVAVSCSFSNRLVELVPSVTVNPHWGVLSKCLTYSKAAADPFMCFLLCRPFRQVLAGMAHQLLKRSPPPASAHHSSLDAENDSCLQQSL
ncbi:hypothetical protein P7K49_005997 [Saguinus oedipus]|uniref:Uncharacterized protein n=1 Tax=Saguinus oedipus TaxID=9490 RepID=A0ABQ9W1X4_SAGOE|nr:hypothetical protein P7K49_005997 [Saguinus oedipus]